MITKQKIPIIRRDLITRIHALCEGENDSVAIMATVSAELFHAIDEYNWVGFYRVIAPDLLKTGPIRVVMVALLSRLILGFALRRHGSRRSSFLMMLIFLRGILPGRAARNLNW